MFLTNAAEEKLASFHVTFAAALPVGLSYLCDKHTES